MTDNAAIGRKYFEAIAARDFEGIAAIWQPGGIDNLVGIAELVAPHDVVDYFAGVYAGIPDLRMEIVTITADDDRCAVNWRMSGTFNGTGRLLGLAANGRSFAILGTDVLDIHDGRITANTAITNGVDLLRQLAILPPQDSPAERAMFGLVNAIAPVARAVRARKRK